MSITASGTDLTGRKKELKLLLKCLKKGEHMALVAPRRFGKSALITEALEHFRREKFLTCRLDLLATPTPELFSANLVREVLRNVKLHKSFKHLLIGHASPASYPELLNLAAEFPFLSGFPDASGGTGKLLPESLDFPDTFAAYQQKQMICAFSHMERMQHMEQGARILALVKSKLGSHTHASYIFSGNHLSAMPQVTGKGSSALFKQEHIIRLDLLNKELLCDSLKKKFSLLKLKLPRRYVDDLVMLTKAHPYYTQQAIRQVILSYVLEGNIPRPKELAEQLLRLEGDYLEKTWESIARNKEYVQVLLALPSGSANIYPRLKSRGINVARAQKHLEEMGLLLKNEESGYTIADPLFELWIRRKLLY